jgi:putative hydrolases of HD superfamily
VSDSEAFAVGLVRFLHRIKLLKTSPRTGWIDRGVPPGEAESIADHSFRTAFLAWMAASAEPELDSDRVLKLALVHDLAEAITGDIPPYDAVAIPGFHDDEARRAFLEQRHVRSPEREHAKRAAEAAAIAELVADLPSGLAQEIQALATELAAGETAEARFVKQADKIETYLQSREYLREDPRRPVASFAAEVNDVIDIPALAALRDVVDRVVFDEK